MAYLGFWEFDLQSFTSMLSLVTLSTSMYLDLLIDSTSVLYMDLYLFGASCITFGITSFCIYIFIFFAFTFYCFFVYHPLLLFGYCVFIHIASPIAYCFFGYVFFVACKKFFCCIIILLYHIKYIVIENIASKQ